MPKACCKETCAEKATELEGAMENAFEKEKTYPWPLMYLHSHMQKNRQAVKRCLADKRKLKYVLRTQVFLKTTSAKTTVQKIHLANTNLTNMIWKSQSWQTRNQIKQSCFVFAHVFLRIFSNYSQVSVASLFWSHFSKLLIQKIPGQQYTQMNSKYITLSRIACYQPRCSRTKQSLGKIPILFGANVLCLFQVNFRRTVDGSEVLCWAIWSNSFLCKRRPVRREL